MTVRRGLGWRALRFANAVLIASMLMAICAVGQSESHPWMNPKLSADERAAMVLKEMTLDEKITLLHGTGMKGLGPISPLATGSNGGAGYVVGIPRLGIPAIQNSDAAYGVRMSGENGRYSTALPCNVASAASWDLDAAYQYGRLIARELRAQGYNMTLGGGINLTREPRNGRTFEYLGEDPVLAGRMVGQVMKAEQAEHVISDIKHYALNDQESGRNAVNVNISERAMRESDLLAFQIGIRDSDVAAVMCSYNRVNGDYACENKYLLTDVLKKDWNFKGFVVSDWGATHSVEKASAAGLDQEEPAEIFYGEPMKKAVESGKVPMTELDDHVRRILRSMFASGIVDDPPVKSVVDVIGGMELAQKIEEQSIVLLKNDGAQLPLDAGKVKSIAVIGPHADVGMISGGGSAQVDPPGGNVILPPGQGNTTWQMHVWFPTSPLKSVREKAPGATVLFDPGDNVNAAEALAKRSDVAIVFAYQWESEDMDLPSLSLPDNQDQLIERVAAANPHTIVVVETGSPATMPWADKVSAIVEAWYGGIRGAQAVANVLFGEVNPSGKLPMTFPKSDADLPHPELIKPPQKLSGDWRDIAKGLPVFQIHYDEGLKVGYKWYDAEHKDVLFPFGYGLSYTSFAYSDLKLTNNGVKFTVTNTGQRAGAEVAQVYAGLPQTLNEPPKRLVGWSKVQLAPGQKREVEVALDPLFLSVFNTEKKRMDLASGQYEIMVGSSSRDLPLKTTYSVNLNPH